MTAFIAAFAAFLPASASALSYEQCRTVAATAAEVVKVARKEKLSAAFRESLAKYVAPEGTIACTGPKEIRTPTGADIDAYNTIRGLLLHSNISLQDEGLRAIVGAGQAGKSTNR
jgi:hypothetical protein